MKINILKKLPLGIWSILLIYVVIIFINSTQMYELILLYPVFNSEIILPEMIYAGFFVIFPLTIIVGFIFLRAWSRRFAMVLSTVTIVLNIIGLIRYNDWNLFFSLAVHALIFYYLIQFSTKKIFHEAAHHFDVGPPSSPPNL